MPTVRKDSKIPQVWTITESRESVVASQPALCDQCVNIASVFTDPSITRRKLEKGGQQIEPIEFHSSVDLWQRSRDKKCPMTHVYSDAPRFASPYIEWGSVNPYYAKRSRGGVFD
jgi:hypothetical protein